MVDSVLEYFRFMNQTVGTRYAIGVYGNGLVNRILREEKLVSYNWISASRAHEKTVDFYNGGQWHLFQNQVDRRLVRASRPMRGGARRRHQSAEPEGIEHRRVGSGRSRQRPEPEDFRPTPLRDQGNTSRSGKQCRGLQVRQPCAEKRQRQSSRAIRRVVQRGRGRRRQSRRPDQALRFDGQPRDNASLGSFCIDRARMPSSGSARRRCRATIGGTYAGLRVQKPRLPLIILRVDDT